MSQQRRVDVASEERDAVLDQFLTLANELYDEFGVTNHRPIGWEAVDDPQAAQPLTPDDVKVTQVWSGDKSAHLSVKRAGHWTLGIDFKYRRRRSMLKNVSTLLSMAAHLQHDAYRFPVWQDINGFYDFETGSAESGRETKPFPYWLCYALLGARLDDRRPFDAFDNEHGHGPVSGGPAICDALSGARRYASGIETGEAWVEAICETIQYDLDCFSLFERSAVKTPFDVTYKADRSTTAVDADDIAIQMPTDEALYDYVEPSLTTFDTKKSTIKLDQPPAVRPTARDPYTYEPVDRMDVAVLLRRLTESVDVHVV